MCVFVVVDTMLVSPNAQIGREDCLHFFCAARSATTECAQNSFNIILVPLDGFMLVSFFLTIGRRLSRQVHRQS